MVGCEKGYLCEVCGEEVESITESDLYLRYVMGEVPPAELPDRPERHIRCNPETAQYIDDPGFPPVECPGAFSKDNLDPEYVRERQSLVTRAWRRLQRLPVLGLPLTEYPLPEVTAAWRAGEKRGR